MEVSIPSQHKPSTANQVASEIFKNPQGAHSISFYLTLILPHDGRGEGILSHQETIVSLPPYSLLWQFCWLRERTSASNNHSVNTVMQVAVAAEGPPRTHSQHGATWTQGPGRAHRREALSSAARLGQRGQQAEKKCFH